MKSQTILTAVALLNPLVNCLPQRQTVTDSGIPSGYTVTTIDLGGGQRITITIPDSGPTIATGVGRSTTIDNGGGRTTSTSSKQTSSSVKSTSTPVVPPPVTTSKTSSSSSPSSTIQSITPKTTSSTSTTKTSSPTPVSTPPPTTKSTSTTSATKTSTSSSGVPTNPWSAACPVPSSFTINDFTSTSGLGGDVSLTITYGNGTFTCPNSLAHEITYNGLYDMNYDDDGLVRVITDGATWIWIQEWFWCLTVPQPHDSSSTLQSLSNSTALAAALSCFSDTAGIRTCIQTNPDLIIPVQSYGTGGIIGFEPIDVNGSYLPQCTTIVGANPVVYDTATCTAPRAATTTTAAPTTAEGFSTTRTSETNTVVVTAK